MVAAWLLVFLIPALAFAGAAPAKKQSPKTKKRGVITRTVTGSATGTGAILSATATCPKKTRVVGGGFEMPPGMTGVIPLIFESQRLNQRSWRASAQIIDPGSPDTATIAVSAYCRRGMPITSTVSSTVATGGGAPELGPSTGAACPRKRRLIAGGFQTPSPLVGASAKTLLLDSGPTGNSWTSRVLSLRPSSLTSYAYCARKRSIVASKARTASTAGSATPPTSAGATAVCPGKRLTTGGGFSQSASLSPGGGYFLVFASRRVGGRSWGVTVVQEGPSASISFSATGLCSPRRLAWP